MATLEKIRSRGALLVIIVGLAMFAFIMSDFLRGGSSLFQQSKNLALQIDGEKIPIQDYQAMLSIQQGNASGGRSGGLTSEENMNLNNRLAQQLISEHLIAKQAEQLGITVSAEEIMALIIGKNVQPSQAAAQFFGRLGIDSRDAKMVGDFVLQLSEKEIKVLPEDQRGYAIALQSQWIELQKQLAMERTWQKVSSLLTRSYAINKIDAAVADVVNSRQIALVRTEVASASSADIEVSDAEIQKFYDSHKNFFVKKFPTTIIQYISSEVRPSSEDYAVAAAEVATIREKLLSTTNVDEVLRNYMNKYNEPFYVTEKELGELGLADSLQRFIKTAAIGAVNQPELSGDQYEVIKLIDKKVATEGMHVAIIQLDSATQPIIDSVRTQFAAGVSFAELSDKYSTNDQLRETGGQIIQQQEYGLIDSVVTEVMATQMGIDTIFKTSVGSIIEYAIPNTPAMLLIHTSAAKPAVEKYRFAYVMIPASFSENTYSAKYSEMNELLVGGGQFSQMAEQAKAKGLNVVEGEEVEASTPSLMGIRSSREAVTWAIRNEKGALSDKLFVLGENNVILIASVKEKLKAGYTPIEDVKEQIRAKLLSEKLGEKMIVDLKGKQLVNLEDYALAMDVSIDTISAVNYKSPTQYGAEFNGHAMTTTIGKVSQPFYSSDQVMVVSPLSEDQRAVGQNSGTQLLMLRRQMAGQMGQRVFQRLMQDAKIVDNRASFF